MTMEKVKKKHTGNPCFGWILEDNPHFWEDNGYERIEEPNFHYYGCYLAKVNKHPIYRKKLYVNYDMEDDSMVELFPCDIGGIKHEYIVAIHTWNNAGGCKCSLDALMQLGTIDAFNNFIMENIGDNLDGGSYILKV